MADDRKAHQAVQQSAWDEVMGGAKTVARKVKEGVDYVNKNVNPLTSDSTKKKAADYMSRAGSETAVGRAVTDKKRLDALSKNER